MLLCAVVSSQSCLRLYDTPSRSKHRFIALTYDINRQLSWLDGVHTDAEVISLFSVRGRRSRWSALYTIAVHFLP
jgi:hypothetical protein